MDLCRECVKYKGFEPEKCYQCGDNTMEMKLEGPTIVGKCKTCGASIACAGLFPACEKDRNAYSLILGIQALSKVQIMDLRALLGVRALEIKKMVENGEAMDKTFLLRQILNIVAYLEKEKISYQITPDLPYSRIWECDKIYQEGKEDKMI